MIMNKYERREIFLTEEFQFINVEMMREIEKSLLEHHCLLAAGKIHRSSRKIHTSTRKKFKEIKFA